MTNKRNLPVLTDEEMAEKIRKSIENGERRMSYKASMEMIGSCVEVKEDGTSSIVKHVLFTDTEGNEVRYPWEALKQVVLEWMNVESEEPRPYLTFPSAEEYEEIED